MEAPGCRIRRLRGVLVGLLIAIGLGARVAGRTVSNAICGSHNFISNDFCDARVRIRVRKVDPRGRYSNSWRSLIAQLQGLVVDMTPGR
jgi:hypothetical protein